MSKCTTTKAFTLIELLITVGIISILAAVAVPNFMEASARAKVSTARNDMRVLANAIEAYSVDYGRPPYDGEPGFTYYGWVNSLSGLTSPVAYLTTPPADPFHASVGEPTRPGHTHYLDGGKRQQSYDYSSAYWNAIGFDIPMTKTWRAHFGSSAWKISSAGPDLAHTFGLAALYDPTNGTMSEGDLIRSQAGIDPIAPIAPEDMIYK